MALQTALQSALATKETKGRDLLLINHIDLVSADKSVNLDVSIPPLGANIVYNMTQDDYQETMKDGFNGLSKHILNDLKSSLDLLIKSF